MHGSQDVDGAEASRAGAAPAARWRSFSAVLVALFLARGIVTLCLLPPLEGWDEYQHLAYIQYWIEHGEAPTPRAPESIVSRPLLAELASLPQPAHMLSQVAGTGALGYSEFWTAGGTAPTEAVRQADVALYQAQHGPLYYRIAVPIFSYFGGMTNLPASIAALRLFNLVLAACALAIVLASLGRLLAPADAKLLGLLIALQPLFLLNSVRVANDSLAVLFASLVIAAAMHPRIQGSGWAAVLLGACSAAAALAKSFGLVLIPFLAIAYGLSMATRQLPSRRGLLCLALTLGTAVGLLLPSWLANLDAHGGLTAMQEALANREAGRGAHDLLEAARSVDWPAGLGSLWLDRSTWVGGWSFLTTGSTLRRIVALSLLFMLAGWGWRGLVPAGRRPEPFSIPATALRLAALVTLVSIALGYHMVHSKAAWGVVTTNSWYAAFAFPWALALAYAGACQWPGRWTRVVPTTLVVLLYAGAEIDGLLRRMPSFYADATGWLALERLASLRPAVLGTPTLLAGGIVALGLLGAAVWIVARDAPGRTDPVA